MKEYWSKLLENGIILAFFTGVAYYLTYLMLAGSLDAYALPDDFVDIDAPDIISTLTYLVYQCWQVLIVPAVGLLIGRRWKDSATVRLWRFSIVMVSAVAFCTSLLGRFEAKNWILIGIMLFEWFEAFVMALILGKDQPRFRDKWARYLQKTEGSKAINERMASGIGMVAVIIAVMYVVSGAVTEHSAVTQLNRKDFFVARYYDDQVVVFENDTRYVLMAREGNKLQPSYEVVRYDHIGKLDYVHTGILTMPDVDAAETASMPSVIAEDP